MARKDQKSKKDETPVGGLISEPLSADDIAEREAEAIKDAPPEPETECPEDENEEPVAQEAGEQTPPAEEAPKKSLFSGKRGSDETPPEPPASDAQDEVTDEELPDWFSDESMDDAIAHKTKEERDLALPAIIKFAEEHAQLAKENNYPSVSAAFRSLRDVAQNAQTQAAKATYWKKRNKI